MIFDGHVVFEWDDVPRSVNAGGGGARQHWSKGHQEKQSWEGVFTVLALKAKLPKRLDQIAVDVELQFSNPGARRDTENFRHPVVKPLADALVKAGFIPDDNPDHFRVGRFEINEDVKLEPKRRPGQRAAIAQKMILRLAYRFGPDSTRP